MVRWAFIPVRIWLGLDRSWSVTFLSMSLSTWVPMDLWSGFSASLPSSRTWYGVSLFEMVGCGWVDLVL